MPTSAARTRPERPRRLALADLARALGPAGSTASGSGHSAEVSAEVSVEVTGITSDHRTVRPGDLFVALPGARVHGARFAAAARDGGAVAVLTDPAGQQILGTHGVDLPVVVVDDVRGVVGHAARLVLGAPADTLTSYAVTGTNGKTTTTFLLEHLLRGLGRTTGLIGTVETRVGAVATPSRLTTPDTTEVHGLLAAMRDSGVDSLVMEVSSHALVQHRVDGITFDVAAFTNLSQDHLDFHGDLEQYFAAKAQLFTPERARRGVVLVDDRWGRRMALHARVPVTTLSTGTSTVPATGGGAADAHRVADPDWQVADLREEAGGTQFTVRHADGRAIPVRLRLPGRFNVANAALAVVMAVEAGHDAADVARALAAGFDVVVPGRMEVIAQRPRCVVDFAHNPDALDLALQALRPTTRGRLVLVVGATGDRDRTKRPLMGEVAARGADVVVITDDDPHYEEPAGIRAEVLAGARAVAAAMTDPPVVREVAPRATAIREAVLGADTADTVLVAGRGHELWQEVDGVDLPLDDRAEVRAALAAREAAS